MLKALVLSFEDKRQIHAIYQLILNYVDQTLSQQHTEATVFALWYFMVQQYFPDQTLNQLYMALLKKHFAVLMSLNDDDHIKAAIYILEEYVLIDFVPANEV